MALKNELCGDDVLEPLECLERLESECVGRPGTPHLVPRDFGQAAGVAYRVRSLPIHQMRALRAALLHAADSTDHDKR
jgi:hypothetical protein